MKYDFDDILLEPAITSPISSRKTIDITYENGFLPLMTAPMDTVVDKRNYRIFHHNKINVVLPRNSDTEDVVQVGNTKHYWMSFGSDEFIELFIANSVRDSEGTYHVLIDIANGHMENLLLTVEKAKNKYGGKLVLMVGNVANPQTYRMLSNAGADYVRIGIGNGGGCLTTQQTGIGYPMASLIRETYEVSCELKNPAKIVADGGFKKYADIIKALALGADYVMLGSIFNKALESCGETLIDADHIVTKLIPIDQYNKTTLDKFNMGFKLFKRFRGMSTKEAQKALGNETLKTSEGVSKIQKVEYTLQGWTENFNHYLASAMSYTGCKNLDEFIGKVNFNMITTNAYNRFNK